MYTKRDTYIQGHTAQSHTYLHVHRPTMTHTNQYTYRETHTHTQRHTCKQRMQTHSQLWDRTAHLWFGNVTSDITGFAAHVSPRLPASQVTEHALGRGLSQVFREGRKVPPPPHRELRAEGLRGRPPGCPRSTWEGPRSHQAVTPPKPLAHGLY